MEKGRWFSRNGGIDERLAGTHVDGREGARVGIKLSSEQAKDPNLPCPFPAKPAANGNAAVQRRTSCRQHKAGGWHAAFGGTWP